MPPKKTTKKNIKEDTKSSSLINSSTTGSNNTNNTSNNTALVDINYDPEIMKEILITLSNSIDSKCNQIIKDSEFMITSLQQLFRLELIKLPKEIRNMTMKEFQNEFNDDLITNSNTNINTLNTKLYETPMKKNIIIPSTPNTMLRLPKQGELLISTNGSPIGAYTVVKNPNNPSYNQNEIYLVPPTPGVYINKNNNTNEIIDVDTININELTKEDKIKTLKQMEDVMNNMKSMMEKLKQGL